MRLFLTLILLSISTLNFAEQPQLLDVIKTRHSGRAYNPDKYVSKEMQMLLMEAARWSASSYNDQPWAFIFCDKKSNPKAYQKALDSLVEANQEWAKNAPLLIIIVANQLSPRNGEPNAVAEYDTGAAAAQMSLQAVSMGLMTHQMGGFIADKAINSFAIPSGYKPMAVMAVGYEADNAPQSPRERNPHASHFFNGEWGKEIK